MNRYNARFTIQNVTFAVRQDIMQNAAGTTNTKQKLQNFWER